MEELASLEKMIYVFLRKHEELLKENSNLKTKLKHFETENEILKLKIDEIETKLSTDSELFGNQILNEEERENIKSKISELISKIDNHLRS
jgi:predicted  nucleic acid-binding Zn-ribbon protein